MQINGEVAAVGRVSGGDNSHPAFCLHLTVPADEFDISLDPGKNEVEFSVK